MNTKEILLAGEIKQVSRGRNIQGANWGLNTSWLLHNTVKFRFLEPRLFKCGNNSNQNSFPPVSRTLILPLISGTTRFVKQMFVSLGGSKHQIESKGPEEARTQTQHAPVIAVFYKHFMQESNWFS